MSISFAELMNEKARSLGCTSSNFANPSGLNDENHYTSAYDMAPVSYTHLETKLKEAGENFQFILGGARS